MRYKALSSLTVDSYIEEREPHAYVPTEQANSVGSQAAKSAGSTSPLMSKRVQIASKQLRGGQPDCPVRCRGKADSGGLPLLHHRDEGWIGYASGSGWRAKRSSMPKNADGDCVDSSRETTTREAQGLGERRRRRESCIAKMAGDA